MDSLSGAGRMREIAWGDAITKDLSRDFSLRRKICSRTF